MRFYQFWQFLTNFRHLGLNLGIPNHFSCLGVVFEIRGVANEGVGPKLSILVLIFPYILICGIFTNFGQFWPILHHQEPILGHLIILGVWKCYFWAQRGWKWGCRTQNECPSSDRSIHTDLWAILTNFDQFWRFRTQFTA